MRWVAGPPRVASWLIERVLPARSREPVLGDLDERFRARMSRGGERRARRWYWRQTLSFVVRLPLERLVRGFRARTGGGSRLAEVETSADAGGGTRLRAGSAAGAYGGSGSPTGSGLAGDVRQAARTLTKRPGLALTVILILGLAVGANTTVFSVVDAILIERLPYPRPDRLVMLWDSYPAGMGLGDRSPVTLEHFRIWSEQAELFSAVGAYESISPSIRRGEWLERVDGAMVSSALLPLLGARPALGRLLAPEDEAAGARPVVVLSNETWESRFGGDPAVVGSEIQLNGEATLVVGVTAPGFWFYDPYSAIRSLTASNASSAMLWQPLPADGPFGGETDYPRYRIIARLRDGVSVEAAAQAARSIRRRLPAGAAADSASVRLIPLSEQVVAEARPRLLGLFGAVSLVLMIAIVNLVSVLLVHLESRRSEFAVRTALGASRGRLARQIVLETTMLALAGGLAGLLIAAGSTRWLLDAVPRGLPLAHRVGIGIAVAAWCIGLALLAGFTIGGISALRIGARRLAGDVAGARTTTATRATRRLHGTLVAAEVGMSLVLLIAATLLLRSMISIRATDTGFDAAGVLTFEATLPPAGPDTPASDFFEQLEERLTGLPGVTAAGATSALPFSRWVQMAAVRIADPAPMADADPPRVDFRLVSPGYFDAIGLPVHAGRGFLSTDREGAAGVAVVNEAFVQRILGANVDPLGATVVATRGRNVATVAIVGVVADVKHNELFETARPILYVPALQSPLPFLRFAVRTAGGDPLRLVQPIRRLAAGIEPRIPLQEFITFNALIAQSIEEETFYTRVITAFAVLALLLTLVGIYGVVSFATRQRDREIGVRMALGAGRARVHRLVLGQGLAPVAVGLVTGCSAGLATTRLLRGLLHGIPEQDTLSFAIATITFALVAAAACLLPARRAARVDPVEVLRGD